MLRSFSPVLVRARKSPWSRYCRIGYQFCRRGGNRTMDKLRPGDAKQLAIAAGHEVDYLLTWNYAHLANPVTQAKAEHLLTRRSLRAPLLVSPESIPQVRFGQQIRRR